MNNAPTIRIMMPVVAALTFAVMLAAAIAAASAGTLSRGTFTGASGHDAGGMAEIVREGQEVRVVFAEDFFLEEAPAARVAFGRDGYVPGTIFAPLTEFEGAQSFTVPDRLDVAQYNEIWLWCEKYDVPLAVAKLE